LSLDGGTVESVRQALVQKIGENLSIRRFARFTTSARLVQYLHGGARIGVTVEIEGCDEATARTLPMHIGRGRRARRGAPVCVSRARFRRT